MAQEIERKFLVNSQMLSLSSKGERVVQGYIKTEDSTTVRIRIRGEQAFLTLKGVSKGISRSEFEYPIPLLDAEKMLQEFCSNQIIEKTRYEIPVGEHLWEVDIFHGENSGLQLAEIELSNESESFEKPLWITTEVSTDRRYFNSYLSVHPFSRW